MAPEPEPNDQAWALGRREYRGGLLRYAYREAASGSALFFHHTGAIRLLIVMVHDYTIILHVCKLASLQT
jgi:hypothetical protein